MGNKLKNCAYLYDAISEDDVLLEIILDESFQRLSNISFLGAIPYSPFFSKNNQAGDRASHSLRVADLVAYGIKNYQVSRDRKRHLIVAALLHDVGHAPFSHSMEPLLHDELGLGHHDAGMMIVSGEVPIGEKLKKIIDKNLCSSQLVAILTGHDSSQEADMFNAKINVDTIDGISHSYRWLTGKSFKYDAYEIADAAFSSGKKDFAVMDAFWDLKGFIYKNLILSREGISADRSAQVFLKRNDALISESFYFKNEEEVTREAPSFFQIIDSCDDFEVEGELFTDREYFVDVDELSMFRYKHRKIKNVSWNEYIRKNDGDGVGVGLSEIH